MRLLNKNKPFYRILLSLPLIFLFLSPNAFAYKTLGVDQVNTKVALKEARSLGLIIPRNERAVKNELIRLKKKSPQEFQKKLSQGIENDNEYQGYLLEIKEGVNKVEDAKAIAKLILYKRFKLEWNLLRLSALNTINEKDFKKFYNFKLKEELNHLYYIREDAGYKFQVGLWGYVTVSKNLRVANWLIQFNDKYDVNQLEPGADEIEIKEE